MISVVIPLYNKEASIKNTVRSVLSQNHLPAEIIVVDDGSTDESLKRLEEIKNPLIRIIRQENRGVSVARNRGVSEATTPWIAFLDGDDIWLPDHLETVIKMINAFPKKHFFSTSFAVNHTQDNYVTDNFYEVENYFQCFFDRSYVVNSSTAVFSKISFMKTSQFDVTLKSGEDIDFWIRLFKNEGLVRSDKVTIIYKMDAENRALGRNINFTEDFASRFTLRGKKGLERKFYKKYLIAKTKSYLYKREYGNLKALLLQHHIGIFV